MVNTMLYVVNNWVNVGDNDSKMKIIKTLYGGYAESKKQLEVGDVLTINLLEEAVSLLLTRKSIDYFEIDGDFPQSFKIKIPTSQLRYLKMSDCSLMFYRFFSCVPIYQYECKKTQETIVTSGYKQVKILTKKY